MERLNRDVSAAFVGVVAVLWLALPLEAQTKLPPGLRAPDKLQARAASGTINGIVLDEGGGALPGAMVSALGVTLASTVTDQRGQFTLTQLPAGDYLLRAHMIGFVASTGAVVHVGGAPAVQRLQLRRLDNAIGTSGLPERPVQARPIIAAGIELPAGTTTDSANAGNHPHTEVAWRLRHAPRSILKDVNSILVLTEDDRPIPTSSLFGRAVGSAANLAGSAASLASSLFTNFPLSGEVNFLTTGALAPGALLSATAFPRGVAYMALAAPTSSGDWSVRAAMSEADLSSWLIAGAFNSRPGGTHSYTLGLAYSTQEYLGGNPAALAAVTDGSRNVGELYAFDTWSITRMVTVEYGGRYSHYDYLRDRGLVSPRFGLTLAGDAGRIRGTVAQRMVVPGAEEFMSTSVQGPLLPPERTFAPLRDPSAADAFRVERARLYDLTYERDLGDAFVLGVGRFHQSVDDQIVTLFGLKAGGTSRSVGHYFVGNAGSLAADGWAIRLDTRRSARINGSLHYSVTRANWLGRGDVDSLLPVAPSAIRADREDIHDLTGSFNADIAETATRVLVIYKLNSAFARSTTTALPGLDGRFHVQINQSLPVAFAGTKWEVLVGLRNLFRDPTDPASVYDELLVVRPPKRLVGGFLVRF
jgi:hypothetical protein